MIPGKGQWDHEWGTGDKTWYYGNPKDIIPQNVVDYPNQRTKAPDGPWRLLYEDLMREAAEPQTEDDTSAMTGGASHASTWDAYSDFEEVDLLADREGDEEQAFWRAIDAGEDPWGSEEYEASDEEAEEEFLADEEDEALDEEMVEELAADALEE